MLFRLFGRTRDREGVSVDAKYSQLLSNQQEQHRRACCRAILTMMGQLNLSFKELNDEYMRSIEAVTHRSEE